MIDIARIQSRLLVIVLCFIYVTLYIHVGAGVRDICGNYYAWVYRTYATHIERQIFLYRQQMHHRTPPIPSSAPCGHCDDRSVMPQVCVRRSEVRSLHKKNISLFEWPIKPGLFWLSARFGPRTFRGSTMVKFHYGIDLAACKGTPVRAALYGIVEYAGYLHGYGNTIVIEHNKRFKTRYAHLNTIRVKKGQRVERGYVIGEVGATGYIRKEGDDGSHLHFELYDSGTRINPMQFLPKLV